MSTIHYEINDHLSEVKLVNFLSPYSEIKERNTTEMYVTGHSFQGGIHFVRERLEMGERFKLQT